MKRILTLLSSLLFFSCMPEEDLPIRNVGKTPEYFIECYCKPGSIFALAATTILPVSENLKVDFSKEMSVTIRTDKDIQLQHTLYTLPGSDFIYNYGSQEKLQTEQIDSLFLFITTSDGNNITASTVIPPAVDISNYKIEKNEATIQFYTSKKSKDNYYIYSVESIHNDSIIDKEICYLDLNEYQGKLTEQTITFTSHPKVEKIRLNLKRITKPNYDYQISLNAANTANQSSITTPVPLKGNIEGALGIFTCYTEDIITISN